MYATKLIEKVSVAQGTTVFYFEKPQNFRYLPGQYAYFYLKSEGFFKRKLTRHFSLITTPFEEKIGFATRMRPESDFKNKLNELPIGGEVEMDGAYGDFVLPKNIANPLIFLAGGIGITPFYAMIKEVTSKKTGARITLFYSNREPGSAAFLDELKKLENEDYKLVATMSDANLTSEEWSGERGRITPELIKKHAPSWKESVYYIAGPSKMIQAMQEMLKLMTIPSSQVKSETFVGY